MSHIKIIAKNFNHMLKKWEKSYILIKIRITHVLQILWSAARMQQKPKSKTSKSSSRPATNTTSLGCCRTVTVLFKTNNDGDLMLNWTGKFGFLHIERLVRQLRTSLCVCLRRKKYRSSSMAVLWSVAM